MITELQIQQHHDECEGRKKQLGKAGPWLAEKNRVNWKAHGLDCMIVRNPAGLHLCGYVGLTKEHPFFGQSYHELDVDVHGGLTYAEKCTGHICHLQEEGEDQTFWLGFDCAHSGDISPGYGIDLHGTYKTETWVKAETERLAEQLATRKSNNTPAKANT